MNARYSPKYFGLKKGVVSYSLVANHVPVNAKIIGANDHESHYVFDILYNNTSDIQPEVHSTDTHGTNAINFAILHLFGYQFAPRYRDLYDTVRASLYGFKHPSQYDDEMVLKPRRKLHPELIVEEWDNIQRIMVSLALKTTTQHIIVRKLSAFALKTTPGVPCGNMTISCAAYTSSITLTPRRFAAMSSGLSTAARIITSCAGPFPTPTSVSCDLRPNMTSRSGGNAPV